MITVNNPPVTAASAIAATENSAYVFKLSDFPYSDPNNVPATAEKAVIIESLPSVGTLTDKGVAVTFGEAIAAASVAAGDLVYTPAAGGHGVAYASFTYAVQNSGGTANGGFDISATSTATINVAQPAPTVSLTATPNPATAGAVVQLVATLTGGAAPGGTVDFRLGATDLGAATVTNGAATLSTSALPVGADQIVAIYSGDADNAGASSAASTVTIAQATPSVSLAVPATAVVGEATLLTATVFGGDNPSGLVDFTANGVDLGAVALANGKASVSVASLPVGSDKITATYEGDADNSVASASPQTVAVAQATPSLALSATPNAPIQGQAAQLTATLSGGDQPSGSVDFRLGSTDLGSATVANGVATLSTTALPGGADQITAVYSGDADNAGATTSLGVAVTPSTPTVSVSVGAATVNLAQPTATVTFAFSIAPSDFSLVGRDGDRGRAEQSDRVGPELCRDLHRFGQRRARQCGGVGDRQFLPRQWRGGAGRDILGLCGGHGHALAGFGFGGAGRSGRPRPKHRHRRPARALRRPSRAARRR